MQGLLFASQKGIQKENKSMQIMKTTMTKCRVLHKKKGTKNLRKDIFSFVHEIEEAYITTVLGHVSSQIKEELIGWNSHKSRTG